MGYSVSESVSDPAWPEEQPLLTVRWPHLVQTETDSDTFLVAVLHVW